jgi:hypothetical protein
MKPVLALLAAALIGASGSAALAQSTVLSVSPIPDDAEKRFCYYEGLAFSSQSLLTVDVPFRRESAEATQKRLLKCVVSEEGDLFWQEFDLERTSIIQQ